MVEMRRPTMTDVAREVGVTAKTVSRVLNDDGPVAAETRERVMEAVRRLGYQPNLMARNMRVGARDAAIGLVIPEMGNPFFGTVAGGIESAVRARGLTLIVGSSSETAELEHSLIATFLARQVSALMIVPSATGDHRHLRTERVAGLPIVFLDRPAVGLTADSVVSANREGARAGVAHLIAHGHRRIGFVGDLPATLYTRRERFQGYRDALDHAGLRFDRALVEAGHDQEAAVHATLRLLALPDPPTALFAANNFASMGAVLALSRARRRDVALVGFDDLPLAEVLDPPLTVVAQDAAAMGAAAATLVLSRLDGDRSKARRSTVPTRLIPRGSGELPPPTTP
ncbi:MAG: LacI family DNA-binding transcriptional regulator [Nonomuraea sp.]|nr:LacI family DNA-binding transcriptional regulator [Nonomuraea sp.]NUP82100.1 LacI family DNA-binding transcriptional regulator [Nonomuraea sp.]NUS05437.1 LacI family DNA-binding transcriptional regulator [Nonomuraea sp.]NUT11415.1 LacI family DNA-binding transcriptional regulator [Nonomuraea sp.]